MWDATVLIIFLYCIVILLLYLSTSIRYFNALLGYKKTLPVFDAFWLYYYNCNEDDMGQLF